MLKPSLSLRRITAIAPAFTADTDELYDLEGDPQELRNLIAGPAHVNEYANHYVSADCELLMTSAVHHDNCCTSFK